MAALDQFGGMAGAGLSINGAVFGPPPATHREPSDVRYTGPTRTRRASGAPVLQGPVIWALSWAIMDLDDFQTLYTIWNLNINGDGTRVAFGINDPRQAGAFSVADFWMDEPQFSMAELYVRNVSVTMTEVI